MTEPGKVSSTSARSDYSALALAGVVQAAALVHRTAAGEGVDERQRCALLRAVPTHKAADLAEVFPDPADYRYGAGIAIDALAGRTAAPEVLRYTLQLIELSGLLRGVPQIVEKLGNLLDTVDREAPSEAELARIYQQTISTLGKRIQVTGDAQVLQREETAERIRSLLLAGIRMAWLWQQLGGRRWHLLLRRGPLVKALQQVAR
jgi:high frequency lysogenization protein